jgi:hypothetical protein
MFGYGQLYGYGYGYGQLYGYGQPMSEANKADIHLFWGPAYQQHGLIVL